MSWDVKLLSNEELIKLANIIKEEVEGRHMRWHSYIEYLHNWVNQHSDIESAGQSPACYAEWWNKTDEQTYRC